MDMNQFFELVKNPELYQKKLDEINAAEKAALEAIQNKMKVDEIEKLHVQAKKVIEQATKDADKGREAAQKEAADLVAKAKKILEDAEATKRVAEEKADEARKALAKAKEEWHQAEVAKAALDQREKGILEREIELGNRDQVLQARIQKLNAALQ